MQVKVLFDRNEACLYDLLAYLKEEKEGVARRELLQVLQISPQTFWKYCQQFNDYHQGKMWEEKEKVHLHLPAHLQWQDVVASFTQDSIRMKILRLFLTHSKLSKWQLAQKLMVSEATVSRQLKHLNHSLQPIGIQLWNGELQGPEHWIRYFYFEFYRQTLAPKDLMSLLQAQGMYDQLYLFEGITQRTFHPKQKMELALWLYISQWRGQANSRDFSALKGALAPYEVSEIYRYLYQSLLHYLTKFATNVDQGEVGVLIAFLMARGLLSDSLNEKFLGYGGPLTEATQWVLKGMKESLSDLNLPLQTAPLAYSSHLMARLYFFGPIFLEESPYDKKGQPPIEAKRLIAEVCQNLFHQELKEKQVTYYVDQLSQLWAYYRVEPIPTYRIGVCLGGPPLIRSLQMRYLSQKLRKPDQFLLEAYQENHSDDYDILISDYYLQSVDKPVFYLKDQKIEKDLEDLKAFLKGLAE